MSAPLWTFEAITQAIGAQRACELKGPGRYLSSPGTGEGALIRADEGLAQNTTALPEPSPSPALRAPSPVPGEGSKGAVTGISIDTRTIEPGDLFVALEDARDGHEFVKAAFEKHAAAAIVRSDFDAATYGIDPQDRRLLYVSYPKLPELKPQDWPLEALRCLGRAARARLAPDARVIAVTGSAGKTTTKEMLRACLTPLGRTHASEKSYNNHWGVPLTLARMPADTQFAVFEIGMNHSGEIMPLSKMVRPHVAIITTVEAVHLEHFASVAAIAEAKAEIFSGLVPGGTAVIPADNKHAEALIERAEASGAKVIKFGGSTPANYRLLAMSFNRNGGPIEIDAHGQRVAYYLAMPGSHTASNSLAAAAALDAIGGTSLEHALMPLASFRAPQGRGQMHELGEIHLIDESYNANPASMRAALETMALSSRDIHRRRIAVLGDMLELGPDAPRLHAELASAIQTNGIDLVLACGPNMRHLYDALPEAKRVKWAPKSGELTEKLLDLVQGGDVVMIKGSNGSAMAPLVSALIARHAGGKMNSE